MGTSTKIANMDHSIFVLEICKKKKILRPLLRVLLVNSELDKKIVITKLGQPSILENRKLNMNIGNSELKFCR